MPFAWAAAASLAGSLISSSAASDAAQTQVDASNRTADMQKGMYDQNQKNLAPYNAQGTSALSTLTGKMADGSLGGQFTSKDYLSNKDPGYQFQLLQGNQALQNSQAAGNGVMSGSALKGMIDYNQGVASTGYQSAYQRWLASQQNTYGQLSGVASLGENAAAQAGNTGATYATNIGNTLTGGANAAAAGMIGSANAISGGISNAGGYYQLSNMMSNQQGPVQQRNYNNSGEANSGQWANNGPGE